MDFPPSQKLAELGKRVPVLNKYVNHVLSLRPAYWSAPEVVFIPISIWAKSLIKMGEIGDPPTDEDVRFAGVTTGLIAWRYSQGVYHFDDNLLVALKDTDTDKPIPIDVVVRLPEYAIYIQLPDWFFESLPGVVGTLVFYDFDYGTQLLELRFVLFLEEYEPVQIIIPLEEGLNVSETLEKLTAPAVEYMRQNGMPETLPDEQYKKDVQSLVSLVLYLCSDKPEIDNLRQPGKVPARPKPKKVKGGMTLFPPQQLTVWEVGRSLGQALRNAAAQKQEYAGGTHASPRAHVRRGHWHGFWTGPRKGDRTFVLKWLHPMLVGMEKE